MGSIAVPRILGEYVNVYAPRGDVYQGPPTTNLKHGTFYEEWIPNDHTFIKSRDGTWHAFGITGPYAGKVHEAEFQSFHIRSPFPTLEKSLMSKSWIEEPKVLGAPDRPDEDRRLYAPCVIEKDALYFMFYGPEEIRCAVSSDLYHWRPQGTIISCQEYENDPMIVKVDSEYYLYTLHHPAGICCRRSRDLLTWSTETLAYEHSLQQANCESPFLVARDGRFYLFWTLWDWAGSHGPYDYRTHVLTSDDPERFRQADLVATLHAHAPEVLQDDDGDWFISSAEYPHRGINLTRLAWKS